MRAASGPVRAEPMMRMMMMGGHKTHGPISNGKPPARQPPHVRSCSPLGQPGPAPADEVPGFQSICPRVLARHVMDAIATMRCSGRGHAALRHTTLLAKDDAS